MHIHARNQGKGEGPRYQKWRHDWGRWFVLRSFLQVFLLQGLLLILVAAPVIFVNVAPPVPFGWLDCLGAVLWLVGFAFEALGDWHSSASSAIWHRLNLSRGLIPRNLLPTIAIGMGS